MDLPTRPLPNVSFTSNFYLYLLIPPLYIVAGYLTVPRYFWWQNLIQAVMEKHNLNEEDAAAHVQLEQKHDCYVVAINKEAQYKGSPEMSPSRLSALFLAISKGDEMQVDYVLGKKLCAKRFGFGIVGSYQDVLAKYRELKPTCSRDGCYNVFDSEMDVVRRGKINLNGWSGHIKGTPCCNSDCLTDFNKSKSHILVK